MRSRDIEKMLTHLPDPEPPADLKARCLDTIPSGVRQRQPGSRPEVPRGTRLRWALGAVPLAVIGALLLLLGQGQENVMAATLRAMERARTVHWIGKERVYGRLQPMEVWFVAPDRYARRVGSTLTLDDGQTRITHLSGGRFAFAWKSPLARVGLSDFGGAALLTDLTQEYTRGSGTRVTESEGAATDGRRVTILEFVNEERSTAVKARMLIDPITFLLIGFQAFRWKDGEYLLTRSIEKAEYDTLIEPVMPTLPDGVEVVRWDGAGRAQRRLMSVVTPLGNEVILRTVDIAENGDVYLLLGRGLIILAGGTLTDDRGRAYSQLPTNVFWRDSVYQIFRPSTPPKPGESPPRRLKLRATVSFGYSLAVKDAPKEDFAVAFDDIPTFPERFGGPPPFEPFTEWYRDTEWDPKGKP